MPLLLAAALLCGGLMGQLLTGKIEGDVFSVAPNGERYYIPGAQVALTPVPGAHPPQSKPVPMESAADDTGKFLFDGVATGCYRLSATSAGLAGEGDELCLLAPGGTITISIEMNPEVVRESVEVSATAQKIETTGSSATGTIQSSTLEHAPMVNERFEDLLPLIPGVVRGPDGLINMKGARATQSGALVNSANVTDPVTGGSAINLPLDVVASVRVLANPFDAQYGKFAGAVSTVETKVSDADKFHYSLQNFLPRRRDRDGESIGIESFTPRMTVSGPLVPGRVAITQALEYRFIRTDVERTGLPQLERDIGIESVDSFTQIDLQLGDRHTAGFNFALYPQKLKYIGLNTFTPQAATPDLRQRGYLIALRDTYVFDTGALLETRGSFKTFDADLRAQSHDTFQRGIETALGGFFNLANKDTSRFEFTEIYHVAPWQSAGQHMTKFGFNFVRNTYDGRQIFNPAEILGVSDRLAQRIDFGSPALLDVDQNEFTFFVQNRWSPLPRLSFDFGVRFDRDSIADENNFAPRAGFVYVLTKDSRTVLRGGGGIFYDRVNLNIPTFLDLPERTETRFLPGGSVLDRRAYRHRLLGGVKNPRSVAWSIQLDREAAKNLFLRVGFQQRNTTRDFLLSPARTTEGDFLTLDNGARSRYREFELTAKYVLGATAHITVSYVRSQAIGDLNDFNSFFGNVGAALIRPNENSRLPFDAPHRFLFWAEVDAPFGLIVTPVWDIHTGFPFSIVDEQRDFVGRRNRAGRFPRFNSVDLQVLKRITLPIKKGVKARIGIRIFNLFNSFNPNDLQNNIVSSRFGTFTNFRDLEIRGKFVLDF